MSDKVIEVFFDCSSPWTYLAFENVQPLAAEARAEIIWRPILVGGVFNAINPSVYESRATPVPAKASYMLKDLQDWAHQAGLKIKMPPSVFPVNSVKAMRACLVVDQQGKLVDFARAVFRAYWSEDQDISQDAVLEAVCDRAAVDPDVIARAADPAVKAALKANTDELIARGGFGSPTLFVNGDDMYFGNDRLELLRTSLRRTAA
ncbi:MAG TPA: 2-hydroxychromene-2-carboxylate isomerase [Caulobacteraceae bacterium]